MTAAEATPKAVNTGTARLPLWRRAILFGTGFGIAVGERDLHVAIVRARPAGPTLLKAARIADFRLRPAAEWGAELLQTLQQTGEPHLAATLLIPRSEIIVRSLHLPGVSDKDLPAAIGLQIETLHPWGDEETSWAWSRTGPASAMIGIVGKRVLGSWQTLFSEAGIPLAAITFSPAAMHRALRLWNSASTGLLCYAQSESGRTEIYGEAEARPVYSTEFGPGFERALAIARSELRLPPDAPAIALAEALPEDLKGRPISHAPVWAAGLVNASPRAASVANLLPPESRAGRNRLHLVIATFLAVVCAAALIVAFVILPAVEKRRYDEGLARATRRLEPVAERIRNLERAATSNRARITALDQFRGRSQADLDLLAELTRLLPADTWTNSIEIYSDSVVIAGEAGQAAPLLKLLDSSPLFQNSEFVTSVTRNGQTEQFRIKTMRRGRIGRTTP